MNTENPTGPRKITAEEPPKWNPAHDSMWLVWYECRKEVVRVCHGRDGFKGFFAPGQDPLWALDNAEPIMEIVAPADQPTAPATPPPAGTETATPEAIIDGLRYIAESPAREHGGFHPNAVWTAKSALAYIATLRHTLAATEVLLEKRTGALEKSTSIIAVATGNGSHPRILLNLAALAATPEQALEEKKT